MNFKYLAGLSTAAIAMPLFVQGCAADELCCTDFKVGADMSKVDFGVDASIKGQFTVVAQTSGDLSAAAGDMLTEVGNACRAIAIDLGATAEEQTPIEAKSSRDAVGDWCTLAANKLKARLGSVSLTIVAEAPKCEASFKAEASCQGSCSVDGKCDVEANPPKCEGGTLEVSCSGRCDVSAQAPTISCTGSCTGTCEGSCTAQGGVQCNGQCDGTCEGNTSAGQAAGKCEGTCKGTCKATAPGVQCSGRCEGKCNAACDVQPGQASVQCDGQCSAKATPISCRGGTLKASCQVDAKCEANCRASAEARASCTPGQLTIGGNTQGLDDVIATLKANLPKLLTAIKVRGEAVVKGTANLTGSGQVTFDPGKLGVKGTACVVAIAGAIAEAAQNSTVSVQAGAKVTGALNVN
jgi:hypothetical protein